MICWRARSSWDLDVRVLASPLRSASCATSSRRSAGRGSPCAVARCRAAPRGLLLHDEVDARLRNRLAVDRRRLGRVAWRRLCGRRGARSQARQCAPARTKRCDDGECVHYCSFRPVRREGGIIAHPAPAPGWRARGFRAHHRSERVVHHAMPLEPVPAREAGRHDHQAEMAAAGLRSPAWPTCCSDSSRSSTERGSSAASRSMARVMRDGRARRHAGAHCSFSSTYRARNSACSDARTAASGPCRRTA